MRRENVFVKMQPSNQYNEVASYSGVPRGCVNRMRLWPLRRDDHSGVLIGAGGRRRFDWPARVLANDVSTRINRLQACRDKWQLAATSSPPLVSLADGS